MAFHWGWILNKYFLWMRNQVRSSFLDHWYASCRFVLPRDPTIVRSLDGYHHQAALLLDSPFYYSETYTISFIRVLLSRKLLHLSLCQSIPTSTLTHPNSMHQKSPKRLRSSMIPLSRFWKGGLDGTRYSSAELDYCCLQILVNYLIV